MDDWDLSSGKMYRNTSFRFKETTFSEYRDMRILEETVNSTVHEIVDIQERN